LVFCVWLVGRQNQMFMFGSSLFSTVDNIITNTVHSLGSNLDSLPHSCVYFSIVKHNILIIINSFLINIMDKIRTYNVSKMEENENFLKDEQELEKRAFLET